MNRILRPIALFSIVAISLASCSEGGTEKKQAEPANDETQDAAPQTMGFDVISDADHYQVPSPNELFQIIKTSNFAYKDGLISVETASYTSSKAQALNFGRLTADIAYTASYEKFQESLENFENLRKISNDLGISYVFDELMVNRVKNNMDNADSLEMISNNSYINIIGQLENNGEAVTLAIISAGGFVESIYILSQLIGEYEEGSPQVQRLADQKLVMENILDYLHQHSDEAKVAEVIAELQPIADIFLSLEEKDSSPSTAEREGKMVLGGQKVMMTKEEFDALKAAARTYRNAFANANQS